MQRFEYLSEDQDFVIINQQGSTHQALKAPKKPKIQLKKIFIFGAVILTLSLAFCFYANQDPAGPRHNHEIDVETQDGLAKPYPIFHPKLNQYSLIFYAFECDAEDCKPHYNDKSVFKTGFFKGLYIGLPELDYPPTRVAGTRDTWAEAVFTDAFEKTVVTINWGSTKVNGGLKTSVLLDTKKLTDKSWNTFEIAVYKNYAENGITAKLLPPLKSKGGKSVLYGW